MTTTTAAAAVAVVGAIRPIWAMTGMAGSGILVQRRVTR